MNKFYTLVTLCILFSKISFGQLNVSATGFGAICNGTNTGYILSNGTGGTAPYVYNLNGGTYDSLNSFSNLNAGTYTVNVKDATLATATTVVTVTEPLTITISTASTIPSCIPGNDATITISASGGTPFYQYSVNGMAPTASNIATSLGAGIYTVVVSDMNNCTNTTTVAVSNPTPPTISSISTVNPFCNGINNGVITIFALAGSAGGPILYSVNGSSSTNSTQTGFTAGNYTIMVNDALGCATTSFVTLTHPTAITISATNTPISCSGGTSVITVTTSGGTPAYQYAIGATPAFGASNTFTQGAGTYTVWARDANNCSKSTTITITQPVSIPLTVTNNFTITNNTLCTGGSATIKSNIIPAGNYTYNWYYANSSWISLGTNDSITISAPGQLVLKVTDTAACSSFWDTINTGGVILNINSTSDTLCFGNSATINLAYNYNGILNLASNNFNWYPSASLSSSSGSIVVASPTSTTTYTIVSTDTSFCADTLYKIIFVKDTFSGYILNAVATNPECAYTQDGSIGITFFPAINPSFIWNSGHTTNIITNLNASTYSVQISDANNCKTLSFNLVANGINCGGISGRVALDNNNNCMVEATELGVANAVITILPNNITTLTNTQGQYSFSGLAYGNYTLQITNPAGVDTNCSFIDSFIIDALNPYLTLDIVDTSLYYYNSSVNITGAVCIHPVIPNTLTKNIYYSAYPISATPLYANVYYVIDSINHFASAIPSPSFINGDTLFWNNVQINTYPYWILVQYSLPMNYPLGIVMPAKAGIIPINYTDTLSYNNTSAYNFTSCQAYDPNDKQVSPQGKTTQGYITSADEWLTYTVRFQNTGNAPAVNVRIHDTISNKLDLSTLSVLNASHNYMVDINNNVVDFKFDGIMLPDSNTNEPASHGFITYQIKQTPTNQANDIINNTAYIYFDYNSPVVTNTTTNTLYEHLQAVGLTTVDNTNCSDPCGNGEVTINTTNGVTPYSYSINPSCTGNIFIGNTIQNLLGNTYTVTVTDQTTEAYTTTFTIGNPVPLVVSNIQTTAGNNTGAGTASIDVSGGTQPYTYQWTNTTQTTDSIYNIAAGTYTYTVIDAEGCTTTGSLTISSIEGIENFAIKNLQVYPNPTSAVLNIKSETAISNVELLNASGQVVFINKLNNVNTTSINTANFSVGFYTLKINGLAVRKISIVK